MCTNITETTAIAGSGKGPQGWYPLVKATVSYDHPFHAPLDHAINIDFLDSSDGLNGRASVELSIEGARKLAETIMSAVDAAEQLHGGSVGSAV
jgi:hypothetical protein